MLKTLHLSGELTGTELARRIGLPFFAFEPVLAAIKQQHQCEVSGGALGSPPTGTASPTPAARARCSSWSTTTTWDTRRCRSRNTADT